MTVRRKLVAVVREVLAAHADPEKAPGMKAYMKSEMPYHGIMTPVRRTLAREVFREHPLVGYDDWHDTVLALWRGARYREERYMALELAGAKAYAEHQTLKALPLYEEMAVTGAWWDYVDEIASHRLRAILVHSPKGMARRMRAWSKDDNLWKRRCSILCQLGRGKETDLDLLYDCIEPNLADREFFIRKAIGWALRDLAWKDLETVERYVGENEDRLSPLSKREALKNAEKVRARDRARAGS